MRVLGIDPGNVQSAYCLYDSIKQVPLYFGTLENHIFKDKLCQGFEEADIAAVEMIASYGMPVGAPVFETCLWIGRFIEAWYLDMPIIYRKDIKLHLCGLSRAKDANVIQVLKDRFGEKGTKKNPGVLYGIKKDEWQALAVAVTYADLNFGINSPNK